MTGLDMKYQELKGWFAGKSVAVAFSGGVDSTLVALAAKEALGTYAAAFTAKTLFSSSSEVAEAKAIAKQIGISHYVIEIKLPEEVANNPPDRCYLCKSSIMSAIKRTGKEKGFDIVVDGTNIDDLGVDRPGLKAVKEASVCSPLVEIGIGKFAVRGILKRRMRGFAYDKPSNPCAATRFLTGKRITLEGVRMVNDAEEFIRGLGFGQVRVRVHDRLARIELDPLEIEKMLDVKVRSDVKKKLKELGYDWVTLDMEGYRMGSMEETPRRKRKEEAL